jgi:hypothetical protein
VRVLLEHVVGRVSQAYESWGEAIMPVQGAGGGGGFGSRQGDTEILSSRLRELLRHVWGCEFKFEFCWLWKGMSWVVRWFF